MRNQGEVVHWVFMSCLAIGNDGCKGCFTSCSSGCGNCNQQRQFFAILLKYLPFYLAFLWSCDACSYCFCTIYTRTSAKANNCLTAVFNIQFSCFFYIVACRIGNGFIIYNTLNIVLFQMISNDFVSWRLRILSSLTKSKEEIFFLLIKKYRLHNHLKSAAFDKEAKEVHIEICFDRFCNILFNQIHKDSSIIYNFLQIVFYLFVRQDVKYYFFLLLLNPFPPFDKATLIRSIKTSVICFPFEVKDNALR